MMTRQPRLLLLITGPRPTLPGPWGKTRAVLRQQAATEKPGHTCRIRRSLRRTGRRRPTEPLARPNTGPERIPPERARTSSPRDLREIAPAHRCAPTSSPRDLREIAPAHRCGRTPPRQDCRTDSTNPSPTGTPRRARPTPTRPSPARQRPAQPSPETRPNPHHIRPGQAETAPQTARHKHNSNTPRRGQDGRGRPYAQPPPPLPECDGRPSFRGQAVKVRP
ncbi:hypothetical protein ATK36_4765 [Amycolatopsis sulphurea]|uniref:Uncharacterized protein n=1 Tax=Amycolatopsis sulphurea TaxID=76022 RepID=A0A2A9FGP4_9PSEU|nr:hypothetical protein ATK36_4765 [Amycolatopsis sulphurea]